MVQKTLVNGSRNLLQSQALIILSCPMPQGHVSGRIERGLRKSEGIREVTINPLTHSIKICYDPKKMTEKEIRSVLKKLHSDRRSRYRKTRAALKASNH